MDFVQKPTPKHITAAKIVIALWSGHEIDALLQRLPLAMNPSIKLTKVVSKMQELVTKLPIRPRLVQELSSFIKPIGFQIFRWYDHLRSDFVIIRRHPKELRWTPEGSIDAEKSAGMLLTDPCLDVEIRFKLACHYCLVDAIRVLFISKMVEDETDVFRPHFSKGTYLTDFWTGYILRGKTEAAKKYSETVRRCVIYGNSVGAEYFSQRSSLGTSKVVELAKECAFRFRHSPRILPESFAQIMRFLLSSMSESQRLEMFNDCPRIVISCFLVWPYRILFEENVNRMWEFFSEDSFSQTLNLLFEDINYECEYCWNREVFLAFWRSSPEHYKRYVFAEPNFVSFYLYKYWVAGEIDLCRLMLSDARGEEKEKMISDRRYLRHLRFNMHLMSGNFLEFFVEECAWSDEIVEKFKNFYMNLTLDSSADRERKKIIQFLNNFNPRQNLKRKIDLKVTKIKPSKCSKNA